MAGSPTALQYLDKAVGTLRQLGLLPDKKGEVAPVVALLNQITDLRARQGDDDRPHARPDVGVQRRRARAHLGDHGGRALSDRSPTPSTRSATTPRASSTSTPTARSPRWSGCRTCG